MNQYLLKINSIVEQLDGNNLNARKAVLKIKTYKKTDFLHYQAEVCRYSFGIESDIFELLKNFCLNLPKGNGC
ncbi:hypothetical protein [Sphingobacterium sp.]|uniref:hypothetical protein n=1 Tax=Sphingobacterium sp. TaxID=341027 RepID=UPI0031D84C9E